MTTQPNTPPAEGPGADPDLGCVWDADDPSACFDETSCGCYTDPCDYFGLSREECCIDMGCEDCCQEMCWESEP